MSPHLPSLLKPQRGVAAVELGFLLIFLLLIAAGIFGFGRAFWYYNALAKATRDGARAMSVVSKDTILTVGVPAAQSLVVAAANGANLIPALEVGDVSVTCSPAACTDGTAPNDVTVQISGYTIDIGTLFPFIAPDYSVNLHAGVPLAPYTTMRYMN
jgi:Flp pilus assembly protein TadG